MHNMPINPPVNNGGGVLHRSKGYGIFDNLCYLPFIDQKKSTLQDMNTDITLICFVYYCMTATVLMIRDHSNAASQT